MEPGAAASVDNTLSDSVTFDSEASLHSSNSVPSQLDAERKAKTHGGSG